MIEYSDLKTNSSDNVSLKYTSFVTDGEVKPYTRNKEKTSPGHSGYIHNESFTLGKMVNEYMSNKFSKLNDNGDTSIHVTLKEFWIEQFPIGNTMVYGNVDIDSVIVANIQIKVDVVQNGTKKSKVIIATSEGQYMPKFVSVTSNSGKTTTTETYRDPNSKSIQISHAININKAIMRLNSYLNEISL